MALPLEHSFPVFRVAINRVPPRRIYSARLFNLDEDLFY